MAPKRADKAVLILMFGDGCICCCGDVNDDGYDDVGCNDVSCGDVAIRPIDLESLVMMVKNHDRHYVHNVHVY